MVSGVYGLDRAVIGVLWERGLRVAQVPLPGILPTFLRPQMAPVRFAPFEADVVTVPAEPTIQIERWRPVGRRQYGKLTIEEWERTFGTTPPRNSIWWETMMIDVVWVDYVFDGLSA